MTTATSTLQFACYGTLLRCMSNDNRLNATHVSLFTGLFVLWQRSAFTSPFAITRKELMVYSKISSVATYHKCIKELNEYGYIRYKPSYHPIKGSMVYWPLNGQEIYKQ